MKEVGLGMSLPSVVVELAAQIITILSDPLHQMYGKVNKFLNNGPVWDIYRVVPYWIDKILLREPEDDDGYSQEIEWLLQILVDGLRTSEVSLMISLRYWIFSLCRCY